LIVTTSATIEVSFHSLDLPRQNWATSWMSFGPTFSFEKECGHETETVLSRADCLDSPAGRAGMAVGDIVRQLGISEQTFYRWKKQYAAMQVEGVRELKILQEENARLKKLVAELSLDKAILQDVASKKWSGPR
jgi:putative transposase